MNIIFSMLLKFCTVDTIALVLAKCISALLSFASKRGGTAWDVSKRVIAEVEAWSSLFNQVYDDDTMTQEEEALVADAIKGRTPVAKVAEILGKVVEEKQKEESAK